MKYTKISFLAGEIMNLLFFYILWTFSNFFFFGLLLNTKKPFLKACSKEF